MRKQWVFDGIAWGVIMYVLITFIFPITGIDDGPITLRKSLISIPVWLLGGLLFGFVMQKINAKYPKKQSKDDNEKMG